MSSGRLNDTLKRVLPLAPAAWVQALAAILSVYSINTPLRQAHFIGQLAHESVQFTRLVENLNYSTPRLMQVWPSRFPTVASALPYANNPIMLGNHVYANRLGNGDFMSGDGYRFRGRGPIQLTGRKNYQVAGYYTGHPLLTYPQLVATPSVGCATAGWFWSSRGLNALADADDVEGVTLKINGGLTNLEDRRMWVNKLKAAL